MNSFVYIYDGTLEGLLTCVFTVYEEKHIVKNISVENSLQLEFGQQSKNILTSPSKATRVTAGIKKNAGVFAFEKIEKVFSTNDPKKEMLILNYVKLLIKNGYNIHTMLAENTVNQIENLVFSVNREIHRLQGFLRFSLMENDVYFSKINPKFNILNFITPHFINRFSDQPFVIFDENHKNDVVYNTINYKFFPTDGLLLPAQKSGEEEWLNLWQRLCDQIAIKERISLSRQMNFCPKRFWKNMPEMDSNA